MHVRILAVFLKKLLIAAFLIFVFYVALCVWKYYDIRKNYVGNSYPSVTNGIACELSKLDDKQTLSKPNNEKCIDIILINDAITNRTTEQLKSFLVKYTGISNTVCLRSRGGNLEETFKISEIIRAHKLNTCIAEYYETDKVNEPFNIFGAKTEFLNHKNQCLSSCVFLLMSGKERLAIGSHFDIGIHHPGKMLPLFGSRKPLIITDPFFNSQDNAWVEIIERSTISDKENFYEVYFRALQTDHDDIDFLEIEYLYKKNLVSQVHWKTMSQ